VPYVPGLPLLCVVSGCAFPGPTAGCFACRLCLTWVGLCRSLPYFPSLTAGYGPSSSSLGAMGQPSPSGQQGGEQLSARKGQSGRAIPGA
jgi:hypothetical protein